MRQTLRHLPAGPPSLAVAVLSVALGFLLGGVLGAVVVGAGVVASPRSGGSKPAAGVAFGLLAIAALATVVEAPLSQPGSPDDALAPPRIGLNYALDRPIASTAARLAAFALLVAIATSVPGAASPSPGAPPARPLGAPGRRRLTARTAASAVPYVAAMAMAIVAGVVVAAPPLPSAWLGLVENLKGGLGYVVETESGIRAPAAAPPLAPLVAALGPVSARVTTLIVSALAVVAVMRLALRLGRWRSAAAVGVFTAVAVPILGRGLAEALALALVAAGLIWSWPAGITPGRAVVAGVCLGGAVLARPEAILAVPAVGVWIGVSRDRHAIPPLVLLLAATAVTLVPWQLWLQERFDRWLSPDLDLTTGVRWSLPLVATFVVLSPAIGRRRRTAVDATT